MAERPPVVPRVLRPNQRSEVHVADVRTGRTECVYSTSDLLLEAPNWLPGQDVLLLNGDGLLYRLDLAASEPALQEIVFEGLPPINNDHVLSPDGASVFLSANDGRIHCGPLAGGPVTRTTADEGGFHFLHGVSPDGVLLAYVDLTVGAFDTSGRIVLAPVAGGPSRHLDTGAGHVDGPEFTPDGRFVLFNTEHFTPDTPGHAQLARIPVEGGQPERLVTSDRVDWFPHPSPDGCYAAYVSFPTGTRGHPADRDVLVQVVDTSDWSTPVLTLPVPGGQGTMNVNSWAGDSTRFAYVSYPFESTDRTSQEVLT